MNELSFAKKAFLQEDTFFSSTPCKQFSFVAIVCLTMCSDFKQTENI